MGEDAPKSWWQTMAGVMTGIAALVTAVAGVIAALNKAGLIGRPEHPPTAGTSQSSTQSGPPVTLPPPSGRTGSRVSPKPPVKIDPVVDQKSYSLALPAKREYVLGTPFDKARYVILAANLTSYTAEADRLAIQMRVMAEGMQGYPSPFESAQFELTVDDKLVRLQDYFTMNVPPGESRERALHYIVASAHSHAVLRIVVGLSNAEVPLDLMTAGRTP